MFLFNPTGDAWSAIYVMYLEVLFPSLFFSFSLPRFVCVLVLFVEASEVRGGIGECVEAWLQCDLPLAIFVQPFSAFFHFHALPFNIFYFSPVDIVHI
jgi:hypothetical protein